MATINDVNALMPKIRVIVNQKIHDLVALPDRSVAFFKRGTPKATNAKGAREILEVLENGQVGAIGEDGVFLTGGGHRAAEMLIGYVELHVSGKVTGKQVRNAKTASAIGGKVGELMMRDYKVLRMQENMNFCKGDGLFSRGKSAGAGALSAGITTVTFDSVDGSYFIRVGQKYFVHNPTTFALKGAGLSFECLTKPTKTTATFQGDITAATALAANDIFCPIGSADGESTVNRACRGYSYFAATTGDYFGIDRDTLEAARGLRVNGGSDMVSHPLLEQGNSLYAYRWGADATEINQVDFIPPAQREAYKLNGYALRRVDGDSYKNYDGAIQRITDGNRMMIVDPHILDSLWERMNPDDVFQYVLQDEGVWDLDGLQMRTPTVSGSFRDSCQWVIFKENQFANIVPAKQIEYFALGTAGVATKIS